MITKALLDLVVSVLGAAFDALPSASLAGLLGSINSAMTTIGQAASGWNVFLPLSEVCAMLGLLLGTWLPGVVAYKVANWLWRHIPDIGGFGPGAG